MPAANRPDRPRRRGSRSRSRCSAPSLGVLAALVLAVSGCGPAAGEGSDLDAAAGRWLLVRGELDGAVIDPVPLEREVDLLLEPAPEVGPDAWRVGGVAGCNQYGAGVAVAPDGDGIAVDDPFSTMMYCFPDELMELETAYLAALGRVDALARDGDALRLTGDGVELEFRAAP